MTIENDFLAHQYDFYTSRGFKFYNIKHKYVYGNDYSTSIHCLIENELPSTLSYLQDPTYTIFTRDDYLNTGNYRGYNKGQAATFNIDCFCEFLDKNNPKDVLSKCMRFTNLMVSDVYFKMMGKYEHNKMIKFLSLCSVRDFKLNPNPLTIHTQLGLLTQEQELDFWDTYLKPRKNDLNKPNNSQAYCNFLNKKFSPEQLKIFFPYFNRLKGLYEEIEISFIEQENIKTTSLLLNLGKMVKGFNIGLLKENDYSGWLEKLIPAIGKSLKAEYFETHYVNKAKKHFRISFSHTGDNINEQKIKTIISDFFKHLAANQTIEYNKEELEAWVFKNSLDKTLDSKDINRVKRMKI